MNVVGLKRAGYQASDLAILKQAYRILYRSGLKLERRSGRIESEIPTPETPSPGGIHPPQRAGDLPGIAGWPAAGQREYDPKITLFAGMSKIPTKYPPNRYMCCVPFGLYC